MMPNLNGNGNGIIETPSDLKEIECDDIIKKKETRREYNKKYRETHKEQTRENSLFYDAKKRAKDKNLEFNITKEDIKEMITRSHDIINAGYSLPFGLIIEKDMLKKAHFNLKNKIKKDIFEDEIL